MREKVIWTFCIRHNIIMFFLSLVIAAGMVLGEGSSMVLAADNSVYPDRGLEKTAAGAGEKQKVLVAYFSCTNTTGTLAEYAAEALNADLYEITPRIPYTKEDLAYYTGGRADQEQNDPNARPEILGGVEHMEGYDAIVLGYPIWHGQAPKIVYTFLESYDFSGKTILPFCTSASSPLGTSASNLHAVCPDSVKWLDGKRFGSGTSRETVKSWLLDAGLPLPGEGECEHAYSEEITAEPTCDKDGEKTYTCSLCGDFYTAPIPATGHQAVTNAAVAAGCETEGKTEGSHCSVCNAVIMEQESIPATGHHYKTDIIPATTQRDGSITRICGVCNKVESRNMIFQAKSMKLSQTSYIYNGKERKPSITVTDSRGGALKEGTDYTVIYPENAKDTGIYKVTVWFRGSYSGTMDESFTIRPKSVNISKITPKKGGFSIKWKKQKQKLSGYEISYSTSRKFTKKTTWSTTLGKGGATSRSVSKLKAKKKFYVRLRAFRTVKEGVKSERLYSGWSKTKTVTTKR